MNNNENLSVIQQYRRQEYVSRMNRAVDYIQENLGRELRLDEIAEIANFSKYHFHRLFRALVGEPLNQFIQRIRIERAASQLIVNPKKSITEITFDCGFASSAAFARKFKEHFGMSASHWRNEGYMKNSKNGKDDSKDSETNRKHGKDLSSSFWYIDNNSKQNGAMLNQLSTNTRRNLMVDKKNLQVEVKDLPAMHVAYVRHIGPYQGNKEVFANLFNKLFSWAGPRGLLNAKDMKVLSVYHDSPEITDEDKLRTSVCITVPQGTKVDGEVGLMDLSGGKYACSHFEISADEYQQAWDALLCDWLPGSGYQPGDKSNTPCFEHYLNNPEEHPEKKHIVDICIPVMPL